MTATTFPPPTSPTLASEAIEASERVAELAARVADGRTRLVLERDGQAVAAVVSLADLERLRRQDEREVELWRTLDAIGERFADVPPEEIEREAVRAVTYARAQRRAEAEGQRSDDGDR